MQLAEGRLAGRGTAILVLLLVALLYAHNPPAATAQENQSSRSTSGLEARGAPQAEGQPGQVTAAPRGRLQEAYTRLPLSFEPNRGQTGSGVRFLSRGQGYTLFLTQNEAVLELQKSEVRSQKSEEGRPSSVVSGQGSGRATTNHEPRTTNAVLTMQLVGANPNAKLAGTDELPGQTNYFIGNDPALWRTHIPTYGSVEYRNIYPGIDLVYYGHAGRLEYDFRVRPGADPSVIRLALGTGNAETRNSKFEIRNSKLETRNSGPSRHSLFATRYSLGLTAGGDLVVNVDGGQVRFHKPLVYQLASTNHEPRTTNVGSRYVIEGRDVRFKIGHYDRTKPLVIDPSLSFATYLGGTGVDSAFGIAVDSSDNVYVTGQTSSANFPVTKGMAFQTTLGGGLDVFVTKLNALGTALVYSTYIGGSENDSGFAIAIDSTGSAYVTGSTNSSNFPTTTGAKQTSLSGGTDAFITKLDPDGTSLVYSTYLGGTMNDSGDAIAVDSAGEAYVAGSTVSINFPTTKSAFQGSSGGGMDAFFTKINASGTSPAVYSTYLGGASNDSATGIAIDSSGNAYLVGQTASINYPVSASALQKTSGGATDAFVTEIDPAQSAAASLIYSTYLGGAGNDAGLGIALDASNNAYVTGNTDSTNFPVTAGVLQSTLAGSEDAFVSKLNPTGSALVYSTYFGGLGTDSATAIAVDSNGNVYLTGNTTSTDLPTLTPVQATCGSTAGFLCDDAFIASLNPDATGLNYSTYLGGSLQDQGNAIALDSSANAYVAGSTLSTDFPTTSHVFQPACALASSTSPCGNAFVAKIGPTSAVEVIPGVVPFGVALIGTASPSESIAVTNTSGASVTFTSIATSGNFAVASAGTTCSTSSSLANEASCTVAVTFTAAVVGIQTGELTLSDNAAGSPQTVDLTGSGVSSFVSLSPASLSFATQFAGTISSPLPVVLTNSGSAPLAITSIAVTAGFGETNNCGSTLAADSSCTISVTFMPASSGTVSGALTVSDSAAGSPQTIGLTGTGVSPSVSLSATSLNFGSQILNTTSTTPQMVTLTNTGTAALSVDSITLTGANSSDFSLTSKSPCGASVGAGGSCTISVNFKPSASGPQSATLTIGDNALNSPQSVALTGTGADFAIAVTPPTASVSAGNSTTFTLTITPLGGFSAPVALTCSNVPTYGSCNISPPTLTPNGSSAISATVTLATLGPASAPPRLPRIPPPGRRFPLPWFVWALMTMGILVLAARRTHGRRAGLVLAATLVLVTLWMACGGANPNNPVNRGTPPGTYMLELTGSSSGLGHSQTVSVTVT